MLTTDPVSFPSQPGAGASVRPATGQVRAALRRAAPAVVLFASVRLTGAALMAAWAWHVGQHPRSLLGLDWDALWYYRIAGWGYGTLIPSVQSQGILYNDLAFFPLYPGLVRLVATVLPIGLIDCALLVAWAASALAAWGIYAIGERLYGRRTAIGLVVLWGLLPHSIVLTMAYTEPLMTAFAAWALYAVLTRRWVAAGALAILAGLTRPNGMAVAAAVCAAVALDAWRRLCAKQPQDWSAWAGAALSPLGWIGYVAWVGAQTGHLSGYFAVQRRWGSEFDYGWDALHHIKHLIIGRDELVLYMAAAITATALLMLALLVLDRVPFPLLVYTVVLVVIALGGANFFQCKPRFLLPAFPLLIPPAIALAKARPAAAAATVLALAGLSFFYGTYLLTVVQQAL